MALVNCLIATAIVLASLRSCHAQYSCPSYMTAKTGNLTTMYCSGDDCDDSECCDPKPDKTCSDVDCSAAMVANTAIYQDQATVPNVSGPTSITDCCGYSTALCLGWLVQGKACSANKKFGGTTQYYLTPTTNATYDSNCCVDKPTCSSYSCKAGMKKLSSPPTLCSASDCDDDCCEKDPAKCYGLTLTMACPANMHVPESKRDLTATSATFNSTCCSSVATCADTPSPSPGPVGSTSGANQEGAQWAMSALVGSLFYFTW